MILCLCFFICIMFLTFPKYRLIKNSYSNLTFKKFSIKERMLTMLVNQNEKAFEESNKKKQVIVISGATAVGKSSVAMELCKRINGEIVIGDSVQVYKYLDIGSNKPSLEDQALVKHHLIDISDPQNLLSSGDYCRLAKDVIVDIIRRDKIPVVVGGSSMWIDWLIKGFPNAPKASDRTIKFVDELISTYESQQDWDSGFEVLKKYDEKAAEKLLLLRNDWYRLRRYLESSIELNKDYNSSIHEYKRADERIYLHQNAPRVPVITEYDIDFRTFFLTEDREHLYQIIDRRCQDMLNLGLIDEVYSLVYNEIITPANPVSKAIGYRQTIQYLANPNIPPQDMNNFLDYLGNFTKATRNYAQRQMKWHRKDVDFLFLDMKRTNPKELSQCIGNLASEILHWANVHEDEYRNAINTQIEKTSLLKTVKSLKKIPFEYKITNNNHRLILAVLLYEKNLLELPLKDMTMEQIPPWMIELYDETKGITPKDIENYEVPWSAEELDIRSTEDGNVALKGFISKVLDPKLKQHYYYAKLIGKADELRHKLLSEKPELMKQFFKEAEKEVDYGSNI